MSDIVTLNGYNIKDEKAVRGYETVALMKADTKLKEGYHVKTRGYYEANDGGHGEYIIVDDETLVDDGGSIHILTNGLRAKLINSGSVNVKQFGAYGDNIHDDTIAINTAITYADSINIPNGTYLIEPAKSLTDHNIGEGIKVPSNKIINLEENAILQCKTNNYDVYQVVTIDNASNVTIKGGHIYGDKLTHTGLTSSEFGCVLYIYSSSNVNIENCEVAYGFGDSITIGAINYGIDPLNNCKNVKIKNCELHNSRRQGISVISAERTLIENCYIHDISGINPQSGIDIESNYADENPVKTCDIINCKFENNALADIYVQAKAEDINIDNCDTTNDVNIISSGNEVNINNCRLNNGIINGSPNKTIVNNCIIKNRGIVSSLLNSQLEILNSLIETNYSTYPTADGDVYITFRNCEFDYDVGDSSVSNPDHYVFYTRPNTHLIVDSCKIKTNGGMSASPAKSIVITNNEITGETNSNGFNSINAVIKNNIFNSSFWRTCSLNTSEAINYITDNIFREKPNSVISGDITGKVIIANNYSPSALTLATNSTNVYDNNNYYPNV